MPAWGGVGRGRGEQAAVVVRFFGLRLPLWVGRMGGGRVGVKEEEGRRAVA